VASWREFEAAEPEFAARALELLTRAKHATMATLRADGSPRISGTEIEISDGDVRVGMMPGAFRAQDLRRDPRVAIHGPQHDPPSDEPTKWAGEAKLAGRAVETPRPREAAHFFRIDLDQVVVTRLDDAGQQLLIEVWQPGQPVRQVRR
jgi:hypothetical protein